jgi:hypothetical protein
LSQKLPKITTLNPIVLEDNRRVILEMVVDDLPNLFSNIAFMMPDLAETPPRPQKPDPQAPSPYPHIELSILNSQRQELASLYIVEHKEQYTSLTLHLRQPDPQEQYIARAEMTYADQTLQVVEVPFKLNQDS